MEHIERMKDEFKELEDKIIKAKSFIMSENFKKFLDNKQRELLVNQVYVMESYALILKQRIDYDINKK